MIRNAVICCLLVAHSMPAQTPATPQLDTIGDPLPPHALHRFGASRLCTQTEAISLAIAQDGKLVAAADRDGRIYLWETEAGKERIRSDAGVGRRVAISPDSQWLAYGGDGPIELQKLADGKRVRLEIPGTVFAFSPDSKSIVVGGGENSDLAIFALATGKKSRPLAKLDFDLAASAVAISLDGKYVAAGGFPKVDMNQPFVRSVVWDAITGKVLKHFDRAGRTIGSLGFLPDNRTLVAQVGSRLVGWDVVKGETVATITHEIGSAFALDSDAKTLVTSDGPRLVDFATGKTIHDFEHPAPMRHVALSPDGKLLAAAPARHENASPRIVLWDVPNRKERTLGDAHHHAVDAVAFSHNGHGIATASNVEGIARIWDMKSAKLRAVLNLESRDAHRSGGPRARTTLLDAMAFSAHRPELIISGQRWDLDDRKPIPLKADDDFLFDQTNSRRAIVSSDGRIIASYLSEYSILFWESATGKILKRIEPAGVNSRPRREWRSLALTPSAKLAALGLWFAPLGKDPETGLVPTIEIWDIAAGKRVRSLRTSPNPVVRLMFAPDGETLAVIGFPHRLELWHLPTGRLLREMYLTEIVEDMPFAFVMPAVAFAPHGQWIAYAHQPGRIAILETITSKEVLSLHGHHGDIASVAFSPNGVKLLSGGRDTTALLWSVLPKKIALPASWSDDDKLWQDLGGPTERAYGVAWALIAHPARAMDVLAKRLEPDSGATEKEIQELIANLSSDKFPQRDVALRRLKQIGARSLPLLEQSLKKAPDLETGRRIRHLLQTVETSLTPETLRDLRALLILEMIATPKARDLLANVARGDPDAGKTRIAQAALARINQSLKR